MRNVAYARDLCRRISVLHKDLVPWAPHLHDPQFLNDNVPEERACGLSHSHAFLKVCDVALFFQDLGLTDGMKGEIAFCKRSDVPFYVIHETMLEQTCEMLLNPNVT
jgi:hypothetical protein